MPLINMKDMLRHAHDHRYAVGAFELIGLDFLQGIIAAAERCRAPVILSLAEPHFDRFDFALLMPAVEAAAQRASVPVAIQLDRGRDIDSAVCAINRGCNGVMVDHSQSALLENIRLTRRVVEMAHACGVPVEGELCNASGGECETACTTVAEARAYVERTGVDWLSVCVCLGAGNGRSHGRPKPDWQRLKQINEALGIPLALHAGSGLNEDQFRRLVAGGVAKINHGTALSAAAGARIQANAGAHGDDYSGLMHGVAQAVSEEVERCLRLWGAAGRAAEVLARCAPWQPIEHLIIYNVTGLDGAEVLDMMAEGKRVLSGIPGVREVVTGKAVKEDAKYHYSWLVRFCHEAVIDSYRAHPAHVAFADRRFRPVAGERISIDYLALAG